MYTETKPRVETKVTTTTTVEGISIVAEITTVTCTLKYDFLEHEIEIPVVNPTSEADFELAFSNREISERNEI